jgi:UDP-4-amino-4,6-dideoxy-N-acetyl-beta-L-altrosamine transaminase
MSLIPYGRHYIDSGDRKAVEHVLRSDWVTQGPKIKEFEDALCDRTGARYAVAVSSGTAALHIACLAAGIRQGDEVLTSPITFAASANSILYCAGKPVFVDVQSDTGNIDIKEIEKKITSRTKAIIPVHFAGHPCDMEKIAKIAKKHGLIIIEDAAHALGAKYKRSKIGDCRYSHMAIFSFHPVKSITTGEGGAVLTNRPDLYKKLCVLRNHGIVKNERAFTCKDLSDKGAWYYEMQELGFNYRITDIQCALGIRQLKKLNMFLKRRREISDIYNKRLSGFDEIVLPTEKPYAASSWHLYYIRVKKSSRRKIVFERLKKAGIGVQVHYIPVYLHPFYQKLGYKKSLCKNAEEFYRQEISIPIYPGMADKEAEYVVRKIEGALK